MIRFKSASVGDIGGSYAGLISAKPGSQYIVLDVCTTFKAERVKDSLSANIHYVRVSPHEMLGFGAFVVDYLGKQLHFPRDGVPRFCRDWKVAAPIAEPCNELVPVVATAWVQQVDSTGAEIGPAFRVSLPPGATDVDALRKATKVELGTNFTGAAARIIAYFPDEPKTVIEDPSTYLDATTEEAPYRFALPVAATAWVQQIDAPVWR